MLYIKQLFYLFYIYIITNLLTYIYYIYIYRTVEQQNSKIYKLNINILLINKNNIFLFIYRVSENIADPVVLFQIKREKEKEKIVSHPPDTNKI